MSLLKWSNDDEEKQREDLLNPTPIKSISSVQSGWKPSQSSLTDTTTSAPQVENYLMSDQKAQVDTQKRQNDAIEAANRAAAAQQVQATRDAQAAAEAQKQSAQPQQPVEKKDDSLLGFLKGLGEGLWKGAAGAVGSGASLISSAVTGDANNDVTKATQDWQKSAEDWGNSVGINDAGEFVGNIPGGIASGLIDPASYMVRGVRNTPEMIGATIAANSSDPNTRRSAIAEQKRLQEKQFGKDVADRGDASMLMEGLAKPGEAILNVATGGASSIPTTIAETTAKQVLKEAVKQGIINLAAGVPLSTLEQAARGQEITPESVAKDAFTQAVLGTLIGGGSKYRALKKGGSLTPVTEDGNITLESKDAQGVVPVINNTPSYTRRTPATAENAIAQQRLIGDGQSQLIPDSTFSADARASDAPQYEPVDTPSYMRKRAETKIPELQMRLAAQDKAIADARASGVDELTLKDMIVERNNTTHEAETYQRAKQSSPVAPEDMPDYVAPTDGTAETRRVYEEAAQSNIPVVKQAAQEGLDKLDGVTPVKADSVPDSMGVTPEGDSVQARGDKIDRVISTLEEPKEYIRQVANAISEPGKSPIKADDIRETLSMYGNKGNAGLKDRIAAKYDRLKQMVAEYNTPQNTNRKNLKEGGMGAVDTSITKPRSALQSEMKLLQKDLEGDIRLLAAQASGKERAKMVYNNLNHYRKSNMLFGAPSIERNLAQDILGLMNDFVKNPKLMIKSITHAPEEYVRSLRSAARELTVHPKSASDIPRYIVGNAYNSIMSLVGVEGAVRARAAGYRDIEARNMLTKLGEPVTRENINKMSKLMGNEAELMAHTAAGVANFMTSNSQFKRASDAFNAYIDNGDPLAKQKFLDNVAHQSTVTEQIKEQLIKGQSPIGKVAAAALDFISPFVRTATNAIDTTVTGTLNPFSKSAADYILQSNRSKGRNVGAVLQNKAIDGAVIVGAVGLIQSGAIAFNNGDEVDKPQGISIRLPDGTFVPIRATHVELTVAVIYTAMQIQKDIEDGTIQPSSIGKYLNIIDNSLPYVDSIVNTNGALNSMTSDESNGGDNGYAATAYGINVAKSYVPGSNNGFQPYIAGKQGKSMNVKSSYASKEVTQADGTKKKVADIPTWFGNAVGQNYSPELRGTLKDSQDAAGRVRTVDNQGVFINKTINDANTKTHNSTINTLVNYARDSKLGNGTQEMFNTYDTGKNNNFKSVQDSITFLDTVDGKVDNTKKLEKNDKIGQLAAQVRDGFYGDTGDELLTLDGKNLYSDVSVPNKDGSKNSRLPLSMQSIKNAIAQTGLEKADSDRLYAISQGDTELYNQLKAKSISYDQYTAAKAEGHKEYVDILSRSESYKKLVGLMDTLKSNGFFDEGGIGSTKSGQTYLWNSLNALLGSKGATPAANYPDTSKSGWGSDSGSGSNATNKPGDRKNTGVKWTPVTARKMASVTSGKYTPVSIKVKLGNEVKKNKTQNYADKSF